MYWKETVPEASPDGKRPDSHVKNLGLRCKVGSEVFPEAMGLGAK